MISARYRSNAWLFPFVELTLILVAALADPNTAESSQGAADYKGTLVWVSAAQKGTANKIAAPELRIEVMPASTKNYSPYELAIPANTPKAQFKNLEELRSHVQNIILKPGSPRPGRVEIVVLAGSAAQDMLLLHEYVSTLCKAPCGVAVIVNSGSQHAAHRSR